jgi:thiol-disulfide isomerase/thioredoxin
VTWCGSCLPTMGEVERIQQKYAERLGLVVVGANLDEDVRRAKEFLRDRKLRREHALSGDWSSTDVPKRFAVSSIPTFVLVGPDGRIVAHENSLDAIAAILDKATTQSTSQYATSFDAGARSGQRVGCRACVLAAMKRFWSVSFGCEHFAALLGRVHTRGRSGLFSNSFATI